MNELITRVLSKARIKDMILRERVVEYPMLHLMRGEKSEI